MKTLFFHQDVTPCADIALHELAGLYLAKRKDELDERDYRNIRKTFELAAEFKPHSGTASRPLPEKHKNAWRGHERHIIFGRAVKEIIERNAAENREFVFASQRAKKMYTEENYAQTIERIQTKYGLTKWVPYQLRHTAFTEVAEKFGIEMADVFVGHLLKTSGKHYDNSAMARQWYVVSRRQGSLALKSEFVPASMRLYTGE